jgi:RNA polymerase nonessential primary-like sigma factor
MVTLNTEQAANKTLEGLGRDSVRVYLNEIGRFRLLTSDQETEYGKQVQKMMELLGIQQSLGKQLGRAPTLAEWAKAATLETTILQAAIAQGQAAKKKMIEANLRLVVCVAKKYHRRHYDLLDLIQEGSIGLERGVEKFDPSRGYKFSTYAYWWIRQAITRAIAAKSRMIRLPGHIVEKIRKIKQTKRDLAQKLGRSPKLGELATEMNMSSEQLAEIIQQCQQPISLELKVGDEQETELQNLIVDVPEGSTPEDYVNRLWQRELLDTILAELPERQRQVLVLRYGLNDAEQGLTLRQISQHMDLSHERIRQLESKALGTLRRKAEQLKYLIEISE